MDFHETGSYTCSEHRWRWHFGEDFRAFVVKA